MIFLGTIFFCLRFNLFLQELNFNLFATAEILKTLNILIQTKVIGV